MNQAARLWKRTAQTRTSVRGQQSEQALRVASETASRRTLINVMVAFQLALHATLVAYDQAGSAAWQTTLAQFVPLCLLWLLWAPGTAKRPTWPLLLLLPCLLLDACLALFAASVLAQHMLPSLWAEPILATALALAALYASAVGGENGVVYGASQFRWFFLALLPLCTVGLNAGPDIRALAPVLGEGVGPTALAALGAGGSGWGVALLWLTADKADAEGKPVTRGKALAWTLLPFGAALLWSLWLCLCAPWQPGEDLLIADRLLAMPRQAGNLIFGSLCGVMWLTSGIVSLCGAASYGARALRSFQPRLWRVPLLLLILAAALLCALIQRGTAAAWMFRLSPWRFVFSAAALLASRLAGGRGGRRKG